MNHNELRKLLERSFATLECDPSTGERVISSVVTGTHYLAPFEVEKVVEELAKLIMK